MYGCIAQLLLDLTFAHRVLGRGTRVKFFAGQLLFLKYLTLFNVACCL